MLSNGTRRLTMESVVVCMHLLSKKRRVYDAIERRKKLRARRQRAFINRQSRERTVFALMLSMAALSLQPPVRSLWVKQRSSYWWEQVVNNTFTPHDWLENFRMLHATFLYLCNELRSTVERSDTVMRWAIPVEQRVALTVWFL